MILQVCVKSIQVHLLLNQLVVTVHDVNQQSEYLQHTLMHLIRVDYGHERVLEEQREQLLSVLQK